MSTDSDNAVLVAELLGEELSMLHFEVVRGAAHLQQQIVNARVQKPGLAFAGYYDYIKPGRVQIVGQSELAYLETLAAEERVERFAAMTALPVPVFIVTKGLQAPRAFLDAAERAGIPVLSSPNLSSEVISEVSFFLEEHLVPSTSQHGVLLEIYGLGVLLIGRSSVGKSECALDLIARGHSLVADDRVIVKRYPTGDLVGYGGETLQHHMELRGLGIVNVKDLFGLAAVRQRHTIDLVVELEQWVEGKEYERLGLDETLYEILGEQCPYILMPVASGRNTSILVEIAARNHVLKVEGHHSAREFARALERELKGKAASAKLDSP